MWRREFITLLGSAATFGAWPLGAAAQQPEPMRRIGVLMPYAENDRSATTRIAALKTGLRDLGWTDGSNVRIDPRYAPKVDVMKASAAELVHLAPDILVTTTNLATITLHQETHTIPIVFVGGGDMIREGLVADLARPGGSVTGFTNFEPAMGSKWLELLKEVAPQLRRVGFLHNPDTLANINDMRAADTAASSLKLEVRPLGVRNSGEIERVIGDFAAELNGGLIVAPNPITIGNHDLIVRLVAACHLPAIYPFDFYVTTGGLMSYGPDQIDMFKRAASYIDRILKGESPAGLPVQMPTKFELVVNQKTAKSLGLTVPTTLLATADKVIE